MSDALRHHGILGMKWGKKNGPPYPLAKGAHSSSEKSAGWEKSLGNKGGGSEETAKKRKWNEKPHQIPDDELQRRINRLQMEEKYAKLLSDQKQRDMNPVRKALGNALHTIGGKIINKAVDSMIDKAFHRGNDDDDESFDDYNDEDLGTMDFSSVKRLAKRAEDINTIQKLRDKRSSDKPKEDKPKEDKPKEDKPKKDKSTFFDPSIK